jgi:general secretion pathway protein L
MDALFFIELPKYGPLNIASKLNWYRQDQQEVTTGYDKLNSLIEHIGHCRCIAVLPGNSVYQTQSTLAIRNRKLLAQALQYDLEEQLAEDVENLHIALQKNAKNGLDVAFINKALLQEYLDVFTEANLPVTKLTTDTQLLANCPQEFLLIHSTDYTLLKTPQHNIALESQNFPVIMETLGDTLPVSIPVYSQTDLTIANCPIQLKQQVLSEPVFNYLCQQYQHAPVLNLLQGEFQKNPPKLWHFIQYLGIGTLTLLLALTFHQFYQQQQLQNQELQLEQTMTDLYKTNFPKARRIIDPVAQMRTGLRTAQAQQNNNSGLFSLLAAFARSQPNKIEINSLQYQQNKLSIDLNTQSLAQLEALSNALTRQGLTTEISAANKVNNRVQAQLLLTGASL